MSERLFGTDGVRGVAGEFPLDPQTVGALGRAFALHIGTGARLVVGGDTRSSSEPIIAQLAGALAEEGVTAIHAGVIPTPGTSWLVSSMGTDGGIVVSASHNPWRDNGIKLLSASGGKLDRDVETAIEQRALELRNDGRAVEVPQPVRFDLASAYRRHLVDLVGEHALNGLRVVLDAANGAAVPFAEEVFAACGAEVVGMLGAAPDGTNINRDCGSTHPSGLQQAVSDRHADLGIAFDGDADRAILVDETGAVRDGDAILYLWARWLAAQQQLDPPSIVATSMSNLGLEHALRSLAIRVVRCDVGDRAVVEALETEGLRLGGEQSGHIVDLDLSRTGDGLLTGLRVAGIVAESQRTLSSLLSDLHRFPQVLLNVEVAARPPLQSLPALAVAVQEAERNLGEEGRLVVRYSGTEPLLRIMIEGRDDEEIRRLAHGLAGVARRSIAERIGVDS